MIRTDQRVMEGPINLLKDVLLRRAIQRGRFKLSAGGESNYYIDCRKASMSYDGMVAIGEAIVKCYLNGGLSPTVVCGPESAGIPIVSAVVAWAPRIDLSIEGCFARKEAKDHGTQSEIEGHQPGPHDKVLMVEDVVTTGQSLAKAIGAVRATGAEVVGAIVLVDRLQGAKDLLDGLSVPYRPLLTVVELGLV